MYKLLIFADDGEKQTMVTVGGERELFLKELSDFFNNNATITRIHSRSEKMAEAIFVGLMKKYEDEQEAQQ